MNKQKSNESRELIPFGVSTPKVDVYLENAGRWRNECVELRRILLDCALVEELKWGVPCYTDGRNNIVLIHIFKEYCAILFFKGSLLRDPAGLLIQQTANVQAARQMRFTSEEQVLERESVILEYVREALQVEASGLDVPFKETKEYPLPEEFQRKLDDQPELQAAFEALTPGRQRAYILHFSQPKQAKTRESRIEKCMERILQGKGLDDA